MKKYLALALLAISFFSCRKNGDEGPSAANMDFTSIKKYDVNSNFLGSEGDVKDEYTDENWPGWVFDLFTPLDTVNLTGYNQAEASVQALYPNPCADTQAMKVFAASPLNMKMVVIDANKNVYFRTSRDLVLGQQFQSFNYSDSTMKPGYYRAFYSFSAEGAPHFKRGHIDIYKKQ